MLYTTAVITPTAATFNAVCEIVREALLNGVELSGVPLNQQRIDFVDTLMRQQLEEFLTRELNGWNSYCIVSRAWQIASLVGAGCMSNTSIKKMGERLRNLLGS